MAKTQGPLFGFSARGSIAKLLTFRRRDRQTIAEAIPTHPDAKSPAQLSWRTMYEACSALWHTLSDVEKASWEAAARAKHMTGFALWQSQCLRPNPGIYLPLAGGTMSGNIAMATNYITDLHDPAAPQDAATKAYADASAGGFDPFAQFLDVLTWLTIANFTFSTSGDATIEVLPPYLALHTGTTSQMRATLITAGTWPFLLASSTPITLEFPVYRLNDGANLEAWLILTEDNGAPVTETARHLGFTIIGSRIWATNADASTQTLTDTGADIAAFPALTRLKLVFTLATDCKFYVNNALKATHTTHLPTYFDPYIVLQLKALEVSNKDMHLGRVLIQKPY